MNKLISDIEEFLSKHGRKSPNEDDEDSTWSSPDALELEIFKERLKEGSDIKEIPFPRSSWESGGYTPYADDEAKEWHNAILATIKAYRK